MAGQKIFESDYEELLIDLLSDEGYIYVPGPDISPDGIRPEREEYQEVILKDRLICKMHELNPKIATDVLNEAYKKLLSVQSNSIIISNHTFHEMLINGIRVEYKRKDGTIAGDYVKLIDFDCPEHNEFFTVNQFTIISERIERRPDVIIFVNGLPLVVIELKNPIDEKATIYNAFNQIQTYKNDIPQLFYFNECCAISDGVFTEVGTLSSDYQHFKEWKLLDEQDTLCGSIEIMVKKMFSKAVLLDLIKNFTVFDDDGRGNKIKKMAAYHQYYAVNSAIDATVRASSVSGDGRCGVVWHTQGSGKSLTMVFYSGKIIQDERMKNPTVVVLTDRIDLDNQLFSTFSHCNDILRQTPQQAESREDLRGLLKVASGGIVFTTINKFFPEDRDKKYPRLTDRHNVIVIVDEAHRSQYDLIDGYAAHMRDALPNASFIAFTGTPIDMSDRNTVNVFGQCISIYDIRESIKDKTTVPIYYESKLIKIDLPDEQKGILNQAFDDISEDMENDQKEKTKQKWSMIEALVGVDKRIKLVAESIVNHFEKRQETMDGKAMIVCMSRRICVDLYKEIIKLRPEWAGTGDEDALLNVIMTGAASDPVEWQKHIRNKQRRNEMALRFKDVNDPFKLVIVRDMWLTGFDVPSMHTMYIDKPMQGHGLMQAISRVNRVFRDKPGGLIVDYIGIADNLAAAVGKYTRSGGKGEVFIDKSAAISAFFQAYEICCDMMHGYDFSWWTKTAKKDRLRDLPKAVDFILKLPDGKNRFKKNVTELTRAYYLATPDERVSEKRDDVAFFQSVRALIVKLTQGPGKKTDELEQALRQALSSAIVSQEPTDVLDILGYKKADISILSDEFLSRIKAMPEKDFAAELLKRMLKDFVNTVGMSNIVQSKKYSEMLEESITRYEQRIIDTTEFILAMINMAQELKEDDKRCAKLRLNKDELAFYDALGTDDAAVKLMGDEVLRSIAMEVAKEVRLNTTVDWDIRAQAKAQMRVAIKKVLRRYKYPPDKTEDATLLIIEQAEALCKIRTE